MTKLAVIIVILVSSSSSTEIKLLLMFWDFLGHPKAIPGASEWLQACSWKCLPYCYSCDMCRVILSW